jgi:hypothetical protein
LLLSFFKQTEIKPRYWSWSIAPWWPTLAIMFEMQTLYRPLSHIPPPWNTDVYTTCFWNHLEGTFIFIFISSITSCKPKRMAICRFAQLCSWI